MKVAFRTQLTEEPVTIVDDVNTVYSSPDQCIRWVRELDPAYFGYHGASIVITVPKDTIIESANGGVWLSRPEKETQ